MEHRALQHALKAERRLHFPFLALLDTRRRLLDVILELLLELGQIGAAGLRISRTLGVSRIASSRCSTVRYS